MDLDIFHGLPKIVFTFMVEFNYDTGKWLSKNNIGISSAIMHKKWRVVAFGFWCGETGYTGEDPVINFGIGKCDLGASDYTYFGTITQDTTAGKHFAWGDMFTVDPLKYLKAPLPLENNGNPVASISDHFLEWQSLGAIISCERPLDHELTVVPLICIEVQR